MTLLDSFAQPSSQAAQFPQSLWIELVGLVSGSQFTSSRFQLPDHGQSDLAARR
jgi:hypothetical protein